MSRSIAGGRLVAVQEDPLIGRERETNVLRDAVQRTIERGPAFVVVAGEPGIGKTTLLRVAADAAKELGAEVGYGRGEPEGAAPLWPLTSAVLTLDTQGPPADVTPTTDGRWTEPHATLNGGPARFAVFERFAADLSSRAAPGPVVLVVDDLQWSDVSTLRLVRHLLDRPSLGRVMVAAGLRTTEPLAADVTAVMSDLLAHPALHVMELSPFGPDEIAAFTAERLARQPTDDELVVLTDRSGGNPFLLGELVRWVPSDGSATELDATLPLAVRESVRRRLVTEDAVTQHVVKAAAVAGSVPSLAFLARITDRDRAEVGRALDHAERAGFLVAEPGRSTICFVHDLARQAVLSLLPSWDRVELHHAVGLALHDVRGASSSVVATHLAAARPLVDDVTLAEVEVRAAEEATRAGAFDEAAEHLAAALELTAAAGDTARRGQLLLERGRVLWRAERGEESKAALGEAVALARRTGDGELLGRAALSWRGGELRPILRRTDQQFINLLREALATCPAGNGRMRCLLLSRWARCAYWDITDRDGIAACDEAVAMARRLGDAEALTSALGTRYYYCWRPELVRERLAVADEIVDVAVATGDAGLIAQGSYFRLVALLELGRLGDAWSELTRFEDAAAASGQPLLKLRGLWFRAARHLAAGDRSRADAVTEQAFRLAARMGRPDVAIEGHGQALIVRAIEGRTDDVRELLARTTTEPVAHAVLVALTDGLGGRPAEAGTALAEVLATGVERIPRDMSWLFNQCGLLAAAVVGGEREAGRVLYDAISPFAGQWAVLNPGILVLGAVDHYLGLGAALLGRLDEAVAHLRAAVVLHDDQPAVPLALLSLDELRCVLARRGRPGDDGEVARLEQRIRRLTVRNTVPVRPLLEVLWSASDAPVAEAPRQRLVLEGDTWLVEFGGGRARLRDQRGLHHLRTLLERPGTEVPALALAGGDVHLAGSANATVLDDQAMGEYRRRISDLQADVEEATANNDFERAARAEVELDALVDELAASTGIGGRSRPFNSADERARVSVTKAIRAAIHHLGEQLPELSRHLTATVHTGSRCVYLPDPRVAERWKTERM